MEKLHLVDFEPRRHALGVDQVERPPLLAGVRARAARPSGPPDRCTDLNLAAALAALVAAAAPPAAT